MRVLLVLVGLLTLTSSAHAECAWVLWYEQTAYASGTQGYQSWNLVGAYSTGPACEAQLAAKIKDLARTMKPEPKEGRTDTFEVKGNIISSSYTWANGAFGGQSTRYVCLPDTVDPRGLKGK